MPEWLDDLRARAARFAGLHPDDLVQALLIRYDPGAGIGWHKDRPVFEHVVGISLGHEATLRLRRRTALGFERAKAKLMSGSIYHLSGEVWTCNGFVPVTYLIMPPWLRTRAG
ncbi:alpha-ketoglutarate-dependent dioxygenase AlkB [Sphingobium sp. AS12]|uniref:alpha-ketoglutarate-dependent dioxygenase AlkB n=1 Tax=Sphingobium sp. AS12 TaxID=2849495 RepID=UPI0034A20440